MYIHGNYILKLNNVHKPKEPKKCFYPIDHGEKYFNHNLSIWGTKILLKLNFTSIFRIIKYKPLFKSFSFSHSFALHNKNVIMLIGHWISILV